MRSRNYISIVNKFRITGKVEEISPFGNGHINDSFIVKTSSIDSPNYLLQRINTHVFQDVESLMSNLEKVTDHIRLKLIESNNNNNIDRECLNLVSTKDGKKYIKEGENYWRIFLFITDSITYEKVDVSRALEGGKAFGNFQLLLSDLSAEDLYITIPDFHNLTKRLTDFLSTVKLGSKGRLDKAHNEIIEVRERITDMKIIDAKIANKQFPSRVVHCDTKLNNILFDSHGKSLCVVDIDTVMPGCILSDFGDAIRTFANTGDEDDEDLSKVSMDIEIFEAFSKGFLDKISDTLTRAEINMLAFSAKYMTYMQAVRFLSDYLNGDTYYKVNYPGHNLVRAKAQLKLLKSMDNYEEQMQNIIQDLIH